MYLDEVIRQIDNIENGLIKIDFNSIMEKNKFTINLISKLIVKDNKGILVINYSGFLFGSIFRKLIQKSDKRCIDEKGKLNKDLFKPNITFSSISNINLEDIKNKSIEKKKDKNIDLIIINKIDTIMEFEEQKEIIYKELEELSKKLKVVIITTNLLELE